MSTSEFECWIDLNLPPQLKTWIQNSFNVGAKSFAELNFQMSTDEEVFTAAKEQSDKIILITKDKILLI